MWAIVMEAQLKGVGVWPWLFLYSRMIAHNSKLRLPMKKNDPIRPIIQRSDWKSNLDWFSYVYQKCIMCIDSLNQCVVTEGPSIVRWLLSLECHSNIFFEPHIFNLCLLMYPPLTSHNSKPRAKFTIEVVTGLDFQRTFLFREKWSNMVQAQAKDCTTLERPILDLMINPIFSYIFETVRLIEHHNNSLLLLPPRLYATASIL